MNKRFIDLYMDMADRIAKMSRAKRLQVGAVVVKDNNIISYSWNGTPAGWDNNCEDIEWCTGGGWLSPKEIEEGWPHEGYYLDSDGNMMPGRYRLVTKPEVLHAEMNALMKLAKSNESGNDSTMFLTHSPCINCAKGIYQAGIKSVYYRTQYRDQDGIEFLQKCGVKVKKVENINIDS